MFAALDIVGVLITEFGVMYAVGYEFGLLESIASVVIIGFSVDYVVHLANAYLESAAQSREDRLSIALLTIGISVLSGAITTFICGIVLCFTEVRFFQTMGVILYVPSQLSGFKNACFDDWTYHFDSQADDGPRLYRICHVLLHRTVCCPGPRGRRWRFEEVLEALGARQVRRKRRG